MVSCTSGPATDACTHCSSEARDLPVRGHRTGTAVGGAGPARGDVDHPVRSVVRESGGAAGGGGSNENWPETSLTGW